MVISFYREKGLSGLAAGNDVKTGNCFPQGHRQNKSLRMNRCRQQFKKKKLIIFPPVYAFNFL